MKSIAKFIALLAFALPLSSRVIAQAPRPDGAAAQPQTGPSGIITTVAGDGFFGNNGDGGPATEAQLIYPESVAVDSEGNLYIPDLYDQVVRKVTASTGIISVYAGSGVGGYSGDGGKATEAELDEPEYVALDAEGNLYISDSRNNVVREVNAKTGIIATVAGNGDGANTPGADNSCGTFTAGVKATKTSLCFPGALTVDTGGNIYVVNDSSQVFKVTASTGIISVEAGSGCCGYSGDGGPAVDAVFAYIDGLAVDRAKNLYIADSDNCAIRKVTAATGIITSLVGTKNPGGSNGVCNYGSNPGDGGPASLATVLYPGGIAVDKGGNIFIADSEHHSIRIIPSGSEDIYTVAGSYFTGTYGTPTYVYGNYGYLGDSGPATAAELSNPEGIAIDSSGNLFIADSENSVIRKVTEATVLPTRTPVAAPGGGLITDPVKVTLTAPAGSTIHYTTNGSIPTTSSPDYTGALSVGKTEIITAFATVPDEPNSAATIVNYFYAPAPVISPAAEKFSKSVKVTITDANKSALIYYTTDNSNLADFGPGVKKYTGPITIDATTTLSAAAWTFAHGFAGNVVSAWGPVTTVKYTHSAAAGKDAAAVAGAAPGKQR